MISLTNASGDPVSSFGSGNSQFAQGQQTNASMLTPGSTFGQAARNGLSNAGFSANTVSPSSRTLAGNTGSFGYATLGGGSRGAKPGSSGAGGGGRVSTIPQLGTDETIGVPDTADEPPQKVQLVPEEQQGRLRVPDFLKGSSEARPGGDLPGSEETSATGDLLEGAAL